MNARFDFWGNSINLLVSEEIQLADGIFYPRIVCSNSLQASYDATIKRHPLKFLNLYNCGRNGNGLLLGWS